MTDSRQTYLCPGCGGEIEFDPESKSNKCLFCDTYYVINRFSAFDDFKKDSRYSKCSNCGGNLVFKSQKIATCQSCQSKFNIIHGKEINEEEIEEVDLISPFVLTTQEAYERFVRRLGEKTNIPLDFFQKLKIKYSSELYVPTVIIVIDYNATYSAKIGFDHYEEYIQYVSEGNKTVPKTKRRKVTEWTNTNGDLPGQYLFERNLAKEVKDKYGCDLSKFNDVINQLCKFNNSHEFENYNERFLVGYTVAKFEYNKTAIVNEIEPLLEEKIHDDIEEHIVADQIQNIKFKYSYKISDDLVYVPVYLYTFEYNDQEYYIAQTGEDGKVFGITPQDTDIEANIKNTMYPFWIYLVASIFFFLIPLGINAEIDFIIKFVLLMLNLPIYLYLNSIKNSKIYANQSHRDEQVDMFLKGELNTFQEVSYSEDGESKSIVNNEESFDEFVTGAPLSVSNLAQSIEYDNISSDEIEGARFSDTSDTNELSNSMLHSTINLKGSEVKKSGVESKPKVNRKKTRVFMIIILILLILTGFSAVLSQTIFKRDVVYYLAVNDYKSGNYLSALDSFTSIRNYKDSENFIFDCKYLIAIDYYEKENLNIALMYFDQIRNYKDSQNYVNEINYLIAIEILETEISDENALGILKDLASINYKDSKIKYQSYKYNQALKLYEEGHLSTAQEIFSEITDFRDSKIYLFKARDTLYSNGVRQCIEKNGYYIGLLNSTRGMDVLCRVWEKGKSTQSILATNINVQYSKLIELGLDSIAKSPIYFPFSIQGKWLTSNKSKGFAIETNDNQDEGLYSVIGLGYEYQGYVWYRNNQMSNEEGNIVYLRINSFDLNTMNVTFFHRESGERINLTLYKQTQ
jgi:TolA-binding protein